RRSHVARRRSYWSWAVRSPPSPTRWRSPVRSYPMPMPFGWFQVAWSDEIPAGTSKPLHAFDRHLVGWRGETGEIHVWDAFCPHLGAHLGGLAKIEGDAIRCPMHSWQYGPDGRCIDIPYS